MAFFEGRVGLDEDETFKRTKTHVQTTHARARHLNENEQIIKHHGREGGRGKGRGLEDVARLHV